MRLQSSSSYITIHFKISKYFPIRKKFILLAKGRGAVKTLVVSHKDCLAE